MGVAEKPIIGWFEFRRLGDNTVEADGVEGLMTVVESKFGDDFGVLGDNPKVVIEATDVGASTGIEE